MNKWSLRNLSDSKKEILAKLLNRKSSLQVYFTIINHLLVEEKDLEKAKEVFKLIDEASSYTKKWEYVILEYNFTLFDKYNFGNSKGKNKTYISKEKLLVAIANDEVEKIILDTACFYDKEGKQAVSEDLYELVSKFSQDIADRKLAHFLLLKFNRYSKGEKSQAEICFILCKKLRNIYLMLTVIQKR